MSDHVFLSNRRRFPRARLSCDIVYQDRLQSWRSQTRDISLGGCRVAGYYPFPVGKSLALTMTHPSMPESVAVNSNVVRICGGAENSFSLAFDKQWRGLSKFDEWIRKLAGHNPTAQRTISETLDRLPIEATLRRAPRHRIERVLTQGEIELMRRLDTSGRPVALIDLQTKWGAEWERKAQVVFDLIADGIILCSMPQPTTTVGELAVESFYETGAKLMNDLESECGPLDKNFARALETMTQEVVETGRSASQTNEERQPIVLPYSGRTEPS
jgi:hypothetical protein